MFQFEIEDEPTANEIQLIPIPIKVEDDFGIGDRIKCEEYLGSIKYIGPVGVHDGIWLGIEWDNPNRGKHSGTIGDTEYFQSSQPGAASFIRPQKARKSRTVFEAIQERYGYDPTVMIKMKIINVKNARTNVSYEKLTVLDLSEKAISDLGSFGELAKICPNVEFLNLAENMLTSWTDIFETCDYFEHLKSLDLSGNPVVPLNQRDSAIPVVQLSHLILGKIKYNWEEILKLSYYCPKLTNLQVPFNLISIIVPPTHSLMDLTSIDLESNEISSWDEVIKLNICKSLEYLNVCGNQLTYIRFPKHPQHPDLTDVFPSLKRLNLTHNLIEDWMSVTELNKLENLEELRIGLNPLFIKESPDTNRHMTIGRIARLKKLEGVEISKQARRDAEIDYMKKFAQKWELEGSECRFADEHPRYIELIKKFGEPDVEHVKPVKTLASNLITLEFIPENISGLKSCTRKVMPNMTVQKLRMLVQHMFKVCQPISSMMVVSSQNVNIRFPLDRDHWILSQYSIDDGDKILVQWN